MNRARSGRTARRVLGLTGLLAMLAGCGSAGSDASSPTVGEAVSTTMPGVHSSMQVGCSAGPRPVSTSQMHIRHMPTGVMRGW